MKSFEVGILEQALELGARELDYILVNSMGYVTRVESRLIGTYGQAVYKLVYGEVIKVTGFWNG